VRQHWRSSLRTDSEGRVLVLIQGGCAWVVDKVGQYHLLAQAAQQLGRHVDMTTDPSFNVGCGTSEPGWGIGH
jgi:hypothetical protein